MGLVIHLQIVKLQVDAQRLIGMEFRIELGANLGRAQHELPHAHVLGGNRLHLVGKDQRAGIQFVVRNGRNRQPRIHDAHVAAVHVLDHQVELVQARAQRHGLLVNGKSLERRLEQGIRKIALDHVFKRLDDAPGHRADSPKQIERRGMHAVVIAEGHLLVLNLHRHGHKNRVAGNPQEIEPVIERNLVAKDARADHFFEILELDRRRGLHFGELLEAGEFVLAVQSIHSRHGPKRRGGTV